MGRAPAPTNLLNATGCSIKLPFISQSLVEQSQPLWVTVNTLEADRLAKQVPKNSGTFVTEEVY